MGDGSLIVAVVSLSLLIFGILQGYQKVIERSGEVRSKKDKEILELATSVVKYKNMVRQARSVAKEQNTLYVTEKKINSGLRTHLELARAEIDKLNLVVEKYINE